MANYNTKIPEELAMKLLDYGYPLYNYDKGTYGEKHEPLRKDERYQHNYRIPTYAQVFDWFAEKKHIIITLTPFFTFSLEGFVAYTWKISQLSLNQAKLNIIQEEDRWTPDKGLGGSFGLTADAAIEYAMTLKDEETHYVDMDVNDL